MFICGEVVSVLGINGDNSVSQQLICSNYRDSEIQTVHAFIV